MPTVGYHFTTGAPHPIDPAGGEQPMIEGAVAPVEHRRCEPDQIRRGAGDEALTAAERQAPAGQRAIEE